jgi:hypothetical protein
MLISVVSSAGIAAFSLLQQTSLMLAIQVSAIAYVVFFVVVTLGGLAAQTHSRSRMRIPLISATQSTGRLSSVPGQSCRPSERGDVDRGL